MRGMNIYLISTPGPHAYDTTAGFVICADDEKSARMIAAIADEYGSGLWLKEDFSSCVALGKAAKGTEAGVLLRDYRAG
jgi:hypothetical protein